MHSQPTVKSAIDAAREHPIGVGAGAAAGAATGAAIGSLAGPVGTVVGGAVGALSGGFAAHETAQALDPTHEDRYWRSAFGTRPYVESESYERWQPAYAYGWEARRRTWNEKWEDVEDALEANWEALESSTELRWEQARDAVRDGWNHVEARLEAIFEEDEKDWKKKNGESRLFAYDYGRQQRLRSLGQKWEELEEELERRWESFEDQAEMKWNEAKVTVNEGWRRIEQRF